MSLKIRVRELENEVGVLRQELVQAGRVVPLVPSTVVVEGACPGQIVWSSFKYVHVLCAFGH